MSSMYVTQHPSKGEITVFTFVILPDGSWEPEWEVLRQAHLAEQEALRRVPHAKRSAHEKMGGVSALVDLIGVIPWHVGQQLRQGDAQPMLSHEVLDPSGCLRKLHTSLSPCLHRESCPSWDPRRCQAMSSKQPPCYDLNIQTEPMALVKANRILDLWRMDSYVVCIEPESYLLTQNVAQNNP